MRNLPGSIVAVALLLIISLGCGVGNLLPKKGQYFEGDSAAKAAAAIREKVGKPFRVIEIFIDEDEFRVQIQDPDKPQNVDEYKYVAGFVQGPQPVQVSGAYAKDLNKSSFPFDEIDFSAIPRFTKEAVDKAAIEGGSIYRLTFQRGFAMTKDEVGAVGNPRWYMEINGTRDKVTAFADPKGKLLEVKKGVRG